MKVYMTTLPKGGDLKSSDVKHWTSIFCPPYWLSFRGFEQSSQIVFYSCSDRETRFRYRTPRQMFYFWPPDHHTSDDVKTIATHHQI